MLRHFLRIVAIASMAPMNTLHAADAAKKQAESTPKEQPAITQTASPVDTRYRIPGLYGSFPAPVGDFFKSFLAIADDTSMIGSEIDPGSNILLLHGPSGNGKSELIYTLSRMAKKTKFIPIKASTIVRTYQNSGAVNVEEILNQIEYHLTTTRDPVLVFIDELEGLNAQRSDQSSNHLDTERAMQTVWQGLSKYERTARVRFAFAANGIDKLQIPFLNRIHERFTVRIDNPDDIDREDHFRKFFTRSKVPLTNHEEFNRIAQRIDGYKDGKSKELVSHINMIHNHLTLIDDQLKLIDEKKKTTIVDLITAIAAKTQELRKALGSTKNTDVSNEVAFYCTCVEQRLEVVKKSLSFLGFKPNDDLVKHVVKETKDFPIRSIMALAGALNRVAQPDGNVASEERATLIASAQAKLKLEQTAIIQKRNDERLKELQLEEAEDKRKNFGRDQFTAYFRLVNELRTAMSPPTPHFKAPHSSTHGEANPTLGDIGRQAVSQYKEAHKKNPQDPDLSPFDGNVLRAVHTLIHSEVRAKEIPKGTATEPSKKS